jgi:hypothetical protein
MILLNTNNTEKNENINNTSYPNTRIDTPGPNRSNFSIEEVIEIVFERFSQGIRIIGPIFAFALTLFVFIVVHAFFQVIQPYWANTYGSFIGFILSLMCLFFLFNILFNYFLAVLVKPGSLEDIRKSRYYRKNDPLRVDENLVDLTPIFTNKNNCLEGFSRSIKSETHQIRYKSKSNGFCKDENKNTIVNQEQQILHSANTETKANSNLFSMKKEPVNDVDLDMDDEEFERQLESKIGCMPNIAELNKKESSDFNLNINETDEKLHNNGNNSLDYKENEFSQSEDDVLSVNKVPTKQNFRLSDCRYCRQHKPLRAHHCSICGYCVFKMDHHCPWINNCVGQNNHRYFVLFLTHLMIGCLFIIFTSLPIVFGKTNVKKTQEFHFVTVLALVGFFLMIFFNSWNWFLVVKGNTTIEFWTLRGGIASPNPIKDFTLNTWRDNVYLVFGTRSLIKAIFLPSVKKLPLSGLEWTKLALPSYHFEITEFSQMEDARIIIHDSTKEV